MSELVTYQVIPVFLKVYSHNTYKTCHILDLLIPYGNKDERNIMLKKCIFFLKKLMNWFSFSSENNLLKSYVDFLNDLPFSMFKYIQVSNLEDLENLHNECKNEYKNEFQEYKEYQLLVREEVFEKNMPSDEFTEKLLLYLL